MWIIVIRICFNKPKRSIEFHCVFHAAQGVQLHSNIAFLTALLHNLFGQKPAQTSSTKGWFHVKPFHFTYILIQRP